MVSSCLGTVPLMLHLFCPLVVNVVYHHELEEAITHNYHICKLYYVESLLRLKFLQQPINFALTVGYSTRHRTYRIS